MWDIFSNFKYQGDDFDSGRALASWLIYAFVMVVAVGTCSYAVAEPVELQWQLSTGSCDGPTAPPIDRMEIYVSTAPIAAMDQPCPPAGGEVDVPPSGGTIVQVLTPDPGDNSVTLDLGMGVSYWIRARVRSTDGDWSNLSLQVQKDLPWPAPAAPTITIINI